MLNAPFPEHPLWISLCAQVWEPSALVVLLGGESCGWVGGSRVGLWVSACCWWWADRLVG